MLELLENSTDVDLAIIDVDANIDLVQTFEVKAVPGNSQFNLQNGGVSDKFLFVQKYLSFYCLFFGICICLLFFHFISEKVSSLFVVFKIAALPLSIVFTL